MTLTPNLALPYLDAAQAQKHVTVNEALRLLDALVMLAVVDRDLATPPAAPADGARYIVAAGAGGAWAGQSAKLAAWQDGAWTFLEPRAGFLAYVADENALVVWTGAAWQAAGGGGAITALDDLTRLGVGMAADATNPFAAKLNNAVWTARSAAEGGDGTLRHKMNKETAAATLSLLMQTADAGRAEIGLTGDDDLHVKVSPDGATWHEAIRVERASGRLSFPASGGPRDMLAANRTYYVRPDGSDANTGLADTAGGAFLSLQRAYDVIAGTLDLGGRTVTIKVADGTYAGGLAIAQPWTGGGAIICRGNTTTPAAVLVSTTGTDAFGVTAPLPGVLTIEGFKVQTAIAGNGLSLVAPGVLKFGAMNFGSCAGAHIVATGSGATIINQTNDYTISGAATGHWFVTSSAALAVTSRNITISGAPHFSAQFALARRLASMQVNGNVFSGAATGARYVSDYNAVIFVNGGGATHFPGDAAGSTAQGGIYN